MRIFILFFLFSVFLNIGFYENYGLYYGKDDIVNYQRLNKEPDLFHLNTWILSQISGEYLFFTVLMPVIIFLVFPWTLSKAMHKDVTLHLISTGLLLFYWQIGLYSQCIAHCLYNLYLGYPKRPFYLIVSVLNHPIFLIVEGLRRRSWIPILIGSSFVIFYFGGDLINYTVLRPDQMIPGMLLTLGCPWIWLNKSPHDLALYIGLFSSNMRISHPYLPYKADVKPSIGHWLFSAFWFIIMFFIHHLMLLQNRGL